MVGVQVIHQLERLLPLESVVMLILSTAPDTDNLTAHLGESFPCPHTLHIVTWAVASLLVLSIFIHSCCHTSQPTSLVSSTNYSTGRTKPHLSGRPHFTSLGHTLEGDIGTLAGPSDAKYFIEVTS